MNNVVMEKRAFVFCYDLKVILRMWIHFFSSKLHGFDWAANAIQVIFSFAITNLEHLLKSALAGV